MAAALAADLGRVASEVTDAVVTVSELGSACHEVTTPFRSKKRPRSFQLLTSSPHSLQVAIVSEADTGNSLADKVRAAMALPKSASLELYLSSDGTPIEAGATLAAQGIGDGAALDVVVSSPKVWVCARTVCPL